MLQPESGELQALRCPLESSIQVPQCHHPSPLRGTLLTPWGSHPFTGVTVNATAHLYELPTLRLPLGNPFFTFLVMRCPIPSEGAQLVPQSVCGEMLMLRCLWGASDGHCYQYIALMKGLI